jgi:gliding motility-associated-like protein
LFVYYLNAQGFTVLVKKYQPDCFMNSVKINVSGNTPPYKYSWGNGMTGDSLSNLKGGVYAVQITDSLGKDTAIAFILNPTCAVSLPHVFTPNGDNINDRWAIGNIDKYPNFLLHVYNRWGQTIHTQKHDYIPWDGTELGLNLPDATYYYMFFYDEHDNTKFEKGSVSIVR